MYVLMALFLTPTTLVRIIFILLSFFFSSSFCRWEEGKLEEAWGQCFTSHCGIVQPVMEPVTYRLQPQEEFKGLFAALPLNFHEGYGLHDTRDTPILYFLPQFSRRESRA